MAFQTSIDKYSVPGQAGQIASHITEPSIRGSIPEWRNLTASPIPFGRLLRINTATNGIELPSATGQTIVGVSVENRFENSFLNSGVAQGIQVNMIAGVLNRGDIWVECEGTPKPGDPVYVRHTANGGLNKLGAAAPATGTGLDLVSGCRFASTATNGLAIISVNLP